MLSQPLRILSPKTNLFFKGRKNSFKILKEEINSSNKNIWFHVSSLGEFEIAKPMIESLKSEIYDLKIVVTFFSPSGLENSRDYKVADSMVYLPLDTELNAKKFIKIVNPKVAVFIKNDIWSNYLTYLKKNNSIIYSVSSKFDESQFYFKFYGKWFLNKLKKIDLFYVQDINSKRILEKYLFNDINISGDSRFTSVIRTLKENKKINKIEKFIDNQKCFIAGSVWEKDIKLPVEYELPWAQNYPEKGLDQDIYEKPYNATKFSLISETNDTNGEVFLTEKIWKAVMAKHIFVIHGNLNYLETFRSLGFKTFSDYFDEGYDTEMHKKTRMEKIKKTCISLQSMDWEDLYKQTQALRQHNYETFFDGEKLSVQVNKTLELFLEFADGSQVPSRES